MVDTYNVEEFCNICKSIIPHREKIIVIAYKTGLSESTISRALSGQKVSLETVRQILRTYQATRDQLVKILL